jgi:hypothetical protein
MAIKTVVQTGSQTARDEVRTLANTLALIIANDTLTAAGCATATTTSQVKTAATLTYLIDGAYKTKGATDNFWTLAGVTVPVASFQKYYLLIDGSGAASVVQGVPASTAAGVVLPFPPQSKAIVGVLTVATDATHTFTPGVTLLGATGITATYNDGFDPSTLSLVVLG